MEAKNIATGLAIGLLLMGMAGAAYYWLDQPQEQKPPAKAIVLLDVSDSSPEEFLCDILTGLVDMALETEGIDEGSTLGIFKTGDPSTALEPVSIANLEIPVSTRVLEGKDVVRNARERMMINLLAKCNKLQEPTQYSAIFLATKRALQQLKAMGCTKRSGCVLLIRTDGQETEEQWLRDSLKKGEMLEKGKPTALDNSGIAIFICGFSETKGETSKGKKKSMTRLRTSHSADLLESLWKQVFTEPRNVVFQPICPRG